MAGVPSPLLGILVGGIAFLYASVGFGGATGYLAVMSQFGIDANLMATTSLLLNVAVSGIAFANYVRAGHMERGLMLTFPLASIPAAFLGGFFKLNEALYFTLLYSVLTYVMFRMLFARKEYISENETSQKPPLWLAALSGAVIGLLSGMVGIGGGIILSPLIILMRWGTAKQAASTAAGFIFLNSISGLLGRYLGGNLMFGELGAWLLPVGVLGALAGSYFGARRFSGLWARRILGVVLLIAVVRFWGDNLLHAFSR
jgi:uncharacterized membrane protein YfcA